MNQQKSTRPQGAVLSHDASHPRNWDSGYESQICRFNLGSIYERPFLGLYFLEVAFISFTCNSFITCLTLGTDIANCSSSFRRSMLLTSPDNVTTPFLAEYLMSWLSCSCYQGGLKILLDGSVQAGIHLFCFRFETRRSDADFVRDYG